MFTCQCEKGYKLTYEGEQQQQQQPTTRIKSKNKKTNNMEVVGKKNEKVHFSESQYSCRAVGGEASLVLASESEVRRVNPYKPLDTHKQVSNVKHTFKIQNMDVLYEEEEKIMFFTDHLHKNIMSLILKEDVLTMNRSRSRREENSGAARVIATHLHDPRGIAVDWIVRLIYYIDLNPLDKSAVLAVMTVKGNKKTTLIKDKLYEPYDLAVDPKYGYLFWTDCDVRHPRIERAYTDGTGRKVLVKENLIWPSGISVDYPTSRLYYVDTKLRTLESVDSNGENRVMIKKFDQRPYRIEIFEDLAYVSMYQNDSLYKLDKHGRGETRLLVQGNKNRISDILIVQEKKQDRDLWNPCAGGSTCHESALCVIGARINSTGNVHTIDSRCLCPDGTEMTGAGQHKVCLHHYPSTHR
jgi:sugar lactone lactonase YvrE